jgi:hypothetical protein
MEMTATYVLQAKQRMHCFGRLSLSFDRLMCDFFVLQAVDARPAVQPSSLQPAHQAALCA